MFYSHVHFIQIFQVFSWGSNSSGQLGHMESPSTVPRLAKVSKPPPLLTDRESLEVHAPLFFSSQLSEGIRAWDISAGERHTLLLADGDCYRPIIYYSGQQVKDEAEESHAKELGQQEDGEDEEQQAGGYTQQPVLLPFCIDVSNGLFFLLNYSFCYSVSLQQQSRIYYRLKTIYNDHIKII